MQRLNTSLVTLYRLLLRHSRNWPTSDVTDRHEYVIWLRVGWPCDELAERWCQRTVACTLLCVNV